MSGRPQLLFGVALGLCTATGAVAQTLETESARLLPARSLEVGSNFEYQFSPDGREAALPFIFEFGLSSRLELAVEPVAFTTIRPNATRHRTGVGDIEITLVWLAARETPHRPALAFAGEVKVPTARDSLIGTGRTDFAGYAIVSRRIGQVELHGNVGYTIVGQPAGTRLNNIASFALAASTRRGRHAMLFAEVLGNSSSVPGGAAENSATPEAAGGELVGTLGAGYYATAGSLFTMGLSLDSNGAVQLRPGFMIRLH